MNQEFDLSVTPNAEIVRVHCSQFDEGTRKFIFHLYDDAQEFAIPAGATIELRATKADNKAYIINNITHPNIITFSGNTITITSEKQMTAAAGDQDFKIRILTEEDTHDTALATARFTLVVDADTIREDTDTSDSVLPAIIEGATQKANEAEISAWLAQSYATGDSGHRPGEATDNAKYYSETVRKDFEVAESYANTATTAKNAAEKASQRAENAAERAWQYSVNLPYIGSSGNWMIYDHVDEEYRDSGVDASITVEIADITMIDADASPYVTNTGTESDPVFHLFIPRGLDGESAYKVAKEAGYNKSEAEFAAELANLSTYKTQAEAAKTEAEASAKLAQSYANGTSGTRSGEATDNAKYYYEETKKVAQGATGQSNAFIGATDDEDGAVGLVTQPKAGDQDKVLQGNGAWGHRLQVDIIEQNGKYGYIQDGEFIPFKSQSDIDAIVDVIVPTETSPATAAHAVGEQFFYNGKIYTVTTAIEIGHTLTVGTNITESDTLTEQIGSKQDALTFDSTPTLNSTNPVTSGGIKAALDDKQNELTFDSIPTANSTNPVTSGGVKSALDSRDIAIAKCECLVLSASGVSALPYDFSNANIETDMVCINSVLSNPSAQLSDWMVDTDTAGRARITGTISGTTDIKIYLVKSR